MGGIYTKHSAKLAESPERNCSEVASSHNVTDSRNPLLTRDYAAPAMTPEELDQFTVHFKAVSTKLRATLEEHGFALVVGVVPEEELVDFEADFAQDLNELIDQEALNEIGIEVSAASEAYKRFRDLGPRAFPLAATEMLSAAAGFSVKRCVSHGRFAWRARRHPNIQSVFRAIYAGADKLVSSMDVTFFTPEGQDPTEVNGFSAHVDQNSHDVRPGLADCETYQGIFYVWPSTADMTCSTTVVWPGSHRSIWPEMMKDPSFVASGKSGVHYSEIMDMSDRESAQNLAAAWACHARRAVVPAGGLLLWNSRTVHTGWRGGPRLAQAVCFEPEARRPEAERLAKLRLAALGLPSTHWASVGMQHDIVLWDAGYAAMRQQTDHTKQSLRGLPLRPAIRPAGLADGADLEALVKLVDIEYRLVGMWDPPEGIAELLEASLKEDYKVFL